MAQFKRTLFATSHFGKSFVFTGEYYTRTINTGDVFTGPVQLKIKAELPIQTYDLSTDAWTTPITWTYQAATKTSKTSNVNAKIDFFACADKLSVYFVQQTGGGVAEVTLRNDENVVVKTQLVDTATASVHHFKEEYANYWVSIRNTDGKPLTVAKIDARVASLYAEVYAAPVYTGQKAVEEGIETVFPNKRAVTFPNGLEPDVNGYILGETTAFTNQQAVSVKLILASSDTNPGSSPVIDELVFYSGDIHDYSPSGNWQCAINLNNVASQAGKSFKRTKRVDYKLKKEPLVATTNPNWFDRYCAIRSAGRVIPSSDTSVPSDVNIALTTYWSPETATYRKYKNIVVPRLSLGHKDNGTFIENKEEGAVLYGPISPTAMNYGQTKVVSWNYIQSLLSFPTLARGTEVAIQLYDTPQVDQYLPVYERIVTAGDAPFELPLALSETYQLLYLRMVLRSTNSTQSPVIDKLDISTQFHYSTTLNYQQNNVSGLDNTLPNKPLPGAAVGVKHLATIPAAHFNVPEKGVNRRYQLLYTPTYASEQVVYFGRENGTALENTIFQTNVPDLRVFSQVTPKEPSATTQEMSADTLYWHYQYDGGTVNFPIKTDREVGIDFTPNLVNQKKYRIFLQDGWPKESFTLPVSLTWLEVSNITGRSEASLQLENPLIVLYSGKIAAGTRLDLPNDTHNIDVSLSFKSNNGRFTEQSIWNGNMANDIVVADVTSLRDTVQEWVSEERFFAGILNPNNTRGSYLRTQQLGSLSGNGQVATRNQTATPLFYQDIATHNQVDLADLLLVNNLLHRFGEADELSVAPGETYLLPGTPSLPVIPPEVWLESENPYVVEVMPNTVRKSFDKLILKDTDIQAGSDDEPGIRYTLKESNPKTHTLTRGSIVHGRDAIPYANINRITRITNDTTGVSYSPYTKVGTTETGDFKLNNNTIDWSPTHSGSKEPSVGQSYTVTFTHQVVDSLKVLYTSEYLDKIAYDKLWRSRDVKQHEAIVGPREEQLIDLPAKESFAGYHSRLRNVQYTVEDNDLWVKSSIVSTEQGDKLLLSLNGKDPKRNWHPTIETGFYYLNDQEYYMYSEPVEHTFGEETLPLIEGIVYTEEGMTVFSTE